MTFFFSLLQTFMPFMTGQATDDNMAHAYCRLDN